MGKCAGGGKQQMPRQPAVSVVYPSRGIDVAHCEPLCGAELSDGVPWKGVLVPRPDHTIKNAIQVMLTLYLQ